MTPQTERDADLVRLYLRWVNRTIGSQQETRNVDTFVQCPEYKLFRERELQPCRT